MSDLPAEIPDEKDIAFEVWFMLGEKNAAKTRRILLEPPGEHEVWERDPLDIPERTIRDWVTRYHWHDKAEQRWRDLAPGIHAHVKQEIALATLDAVRWARKVARGEIDKPDKVQATVNLSLLDRGGHLPETRKNDGSLPSGPTRNYEQSVKGLSDDDLRRLLWAEPEES